MSAASPPAAYSVWQPDFDAQVGARLVVLLDGNLQTFVTEYNCEEGWLTRHATDAEGKPSLNDARDDVLTEWRDGLVEVRWKGDANG